VAARADRGAPKGSRGSPIRDARGCHTDHGPRPRHCTHRPDQTHAARRGHFAPSTPRPTRQNTDRATPTARRYTSPPHEHELPTIRQRSAALGHSWRAGPVRGKTRSRPQVSSRSGVTYAPDGRRSTGEKHPRRPATLDRRHPVDGPAECPPALGPVEPAARPGSPPSQWPTQHRRPAAPSRDHLPGSPPVPPVDAVRHQNALLSPRGTPTDSPARVQRSGDQA